MIDRDEAWVLRCIEHKKRNGIGTGIEKDGKCEFWFKEGFDAALQAGTSHNSAMPGGLPPQICEAQTSA